MSRLSEVVGALFHHLLSATALTFVEFFILFGPLLIAALASHAISRRVEGRTIQLAGANAYIYVLGWLGTPVHELGHALMCVLFRHEIKEIKLFAPDKKTGQLGYVLHGFDPKSIYQQVGNFFIAIGPILLGGGVLFAAARLLVGPGFNSQADATGGIDSIGAIPGALAAWLGETVSTLGRFFSALAFKDYKTWIFLYLTVAVGSHVNLSPADLMSGKHGFFLICLLLFLANIILTVFTDVPFGAFHFAGRYMGLLASIVLASAGLLLPLLLVLETLALITRK